MAERTPRRRRGRGGLRAGAGLLGALVLLGFAAPWLAPYDPTDQLDPVAAKHRPPLTRMALVKLEHGVHLLADRVERRGDQLVVERRGEVEVLPAAEVGNLAGAGVGDHRFFLLGSDRFGRDVFSRWIHGARVSFLIGSLSLGLSLGLGVVIGALAGLGGPIVDSLLMRLVDGLLTIPWIFLVIALTALFPSGTTPLILILGGTGWMGVARLLRAELLSLRERGFVEAARGLGAGPGHVFFRHLLPNAMTPLLVDSTLRIGRLILVEASLSFLGFGVQPPLPSWGNMIAEGSDFILSAWWVAFFPAVALVATVVSLNLMGDGLRDVLDPRRTPGPAR